MVSLTFMKLKAQNHGVISGSVTQKGHEGTIGVIAVRHEITSPRDAASGLPTGKRQHKPFLIIKELDRSSPQLYSVLVNNENIPELEVQFWESGLRGREKLIYTIKMTNASIASIDFHMDSSQPELAASSRYEILSFTYQKIEWTWFDGNITASDDWEAPVV